MESKNKDIYTQTTSFRMPKRDAMRLQEIAEEIGTTKTMILSLLVKNFIRGNIIIPDSTKFKK
nr:hypothetical protein [uncultured Cetobacterium sp.]